MSLGVTESWRRYVAGNTLFYLEGCVSDGSASSLPTPLGHSFSLKSLHLSKRSHIVTGVIFLWESQGIF